MESETELRFVN